MGLARFDELFSLVKQRPTRKLVAVNGTDSHTLEALSEAVTLGLVSAVITGDRNQIRISCDLLKVDPEIFEIIDASSVPEAAECAVQLIHKGAADMLMKGLVPTDLFMKVLLKKEFDLVGAQGVLSHLAVVENPNFPKLLIFSDAAVIPYPELKQKITMVRYLIDAARKLGIETPRIAVIAPTEQIVPSISACTDGAILAKMSEVGQIMGGVVDGPMGLDVAIDREAAVIKGFSSVVAGDADCLLFPNIDAANVFYKTNSKLCHALMAGVITGARVPVIVSSRGDSKETKLNSIVLASLLS